MPRNKFLVSALVAAIAGVPLLLSARGSASIRAAGPQLAHMVFFTLKDHSKESRGKFVASCHKYLSGHEGAKYFSIGTIAEDVEEPVSVRDFDVALHVVFESKEAEGKYLKAPRHLEFVEENKDAWSKVRVFDSYVMER